MAGGSGGGAFFVVCFCLLVSVAAAFGEPFLVDADAFAVECGDGGFEIEDEAVVMVEVDVYETDAGVDVALEGGDQTVDAH